MEIKLNNVTLIITGDDAERLFAGMVARLGQLEEKLGEVESQLSTLQTESDNHDEALQTLELRLDDFPDVDDKADSDHTHDDYLTADDLNDIKSDLFSIHRIFDGFKVTLEREIVDAS